MCDIYNNATFLKIFAPVECVVHESIVDSEISETIGKNSVAKIQHEFNSIAVC